MNTVIVSLICTSEVHCIPQLPNNKLMTLRFVVQPCDVSLICTIQVCKVEKSLSYYREKEEEIMKPDEFEL